MRQRVAISHDWLLRHRGGEKILKEFCLNFEDLAIFTLFFRPDRIDPAIGEHSIFVSPLGRWPGVNHYYPYLLPFFRYGIERFYVQEVDVLLSISHAVAKGIPHASGIPHICYCLTPMRYLWSEQLYFPKPEWSLKRKLLNVFSKRLRAWDLASNRGVDFFVAISQTVSKRIQKIYGRPSQVIYPCIDAEFFHPLDVPREEFYLIVSSLVPYKRIDLAVEAFNQNGKSLLIAGEGSLRRKLSSKARPNVRFLGWQPNEEIRRLYSQARALIFPGTEDLGLVPLEAQACGCPVIAYGEGGATETVTEGETGLFFREPTAEGLCEAVRQFEYASFDPGKAVKKASRFSRFRFLSEWRHYFSSRGLLALWDQIGDR